MTGLLSPSLHSGYAYAS